MDLTLRDEMAIAAMKGILSGVMVLNPMSNQPREPWEVAQMAYTMADVMLHTREQEVTTPDAPETTPDAPMTTLGTGL